MKSNHVHLCGLGPLPGGLDGRRHRLQRIHDSHRVGQAEVLATLPDLIAGNDHFEFFWFPYTDRVWLKGKLHDRDAESLRPAYPRFADFLALRDRLDPGRILANAYTERVLGL